MAKMVAEELKEFNIPEEGYYNSLYNYTYDTEARASWKYGCSRGVSGTPTYLA
jgi:hypothetical protein